MLLRIRTVKPGFFWDEDLAKYPPLCRIFLEGLWCAADKMGRLEDRPMMLHRLILPYEREGELAEEFLGLLSSPGPIRGSKYINRYEMGGKRYIQLLNFLEDHRPGKFEPPSAIPSPDGFVADLMAFATTVDAKLRRDVYLRDNHNCVYCGAELENEPRKICVDYVVPQSQGGATSRKNLVTSCKKCHGRKAERNPDEAGMTWPEGFGEKVAERPVQHFLPLDVVADPVTTPSNGGHDPVNPPLKTGQRNVDGGSTPPQHTVNPPLTCGQPTVDDPSTTVNPPLTCGQPTVDDPSTTVNPVSKAGEQPDDNPVARKGKDSHVNERNVNIVRRQPPSPPPSEPGGASAVLGDFEESPEQGSGRPAEISLEKRGNGNNGNNWNKRPRPLERTKESDEIIAYLNQKLGSNYQPDGQKSLGCIIGHLERGFDVSQFKGVVDRKVKQWKRDPDYSVYLRPQTLFGENFEAYVYELDGNRERRKGELIAACKNRTVVGLVVEWVLKEGFSVNDRQLVLYEYASDVKKAIKADDLSELERLSKEDLFERLRKSREVGSAG
jgi:uncharacterized phage protein (TIGR02220 family)